MGKRQQDPAEGSSRKDEGQRMDTLRRNAGGRCDKAWQLIGRGDEETRRVRHVSRISDLNESDLPPYHPMPNAAHTSEPGLQCGSRVPWDGPFTTRPRHNARPSQKVFFRSTHSDYIFTTLFSIYHSCITVVYIFVFFFPLRIFFNCLKT